MKRKLSIILLSFALVLNLAAPAFAAESNTTKPEQRGVNYLCLGDSIAAGYGLEKDTVEERSVDKASLNILTRDFAIKNAYSTLLNNYFVEKSAAGKSADCSMVASRLREVNTILGITKADGYTDEMFYGMTDTNINEYDKDELADYIANADVITVNYGSNELLTNTIYSLMKAEDLDLSFIDEETSETDMMKFLKTLVGLEIAVQRNVADFIVQWTSFVNYVNKNNKNNAKIVFVGVYNPISCIEVSEENRQFVDAFNKCIDVNIAEINGTVYTTAMNKKNNVLFVDTNNIEKKEYFEGTGDSIHPNAAGHKLIYDKIVSRLESNENCDHRVCKAYEKAATCFETGYKNKLICSVCGRTIDEGTVVPTLKASIKTGKLPCKIKQKFNVADNLKLPGGNEVVAVSSSNSKIASVSGTTVQGKKKGIATIKATLANNQVLSFKVSVQKGNVKASKITTAFSSVTLKKGKTAAIKAGKAPCTCKYKITYKTSAKKIATVSKSGIITAKKAGKAKITVKCGGKKKTIKVTVK